MYAFDFEKPTSLNEAVTALQTEEAMPLGGGQTLIPSLKQRLAAPSKLVSLRGVDEIRGICRDDAGRICIGGGTTLPGAGPPGTAAVVDDPVAEASAALVALGYKSAEAQRLLKDVDGESSETLIRAALQKAVR